MQLYFCYVNLVLIIPVLKKDEILTNVWGISERINTHTLETHVYSLKKKLGALECKHTFICSDNLGGYYFKELET